MKMHKNIGTNRMDVFFAFKPTSFEQVKETRATGHPATRQIVAITQAIRFTPAQYDAFVADFFQPLPFLSGRGGPQDCLLVQAQGRPSLVVNSEGYDYARYVAMI